MISTDPGVWIAAFLTICVWSFLFRENVFSRFAEYTFVGMMTGHLIVMGTSTIQRFASVPLSRGDVSVLIPIILGLLLYFTVSKKHYWLSRWPTALLVGTATAIAMRGFLSAYLIPQTIGNFDAASVVVRGDAMSAFNSALIIGGVHISLPGLVLPRRSVFVIRVHGEELQKSLG